MPIPQHVLQRVRSAPSSGEGLARIFEQIALTAELLGGAIGQFTLDFQRADDPVVEGDLIPVIVLTLRPATPTEIEP